MSISSKSSLRTRAEDSHVEPVFGNFLNFQNPDKRPNTPRQLRR